MRGFVMEKKIYFIQPTYRKMDGKPLKGWNFFHHSINLTMVSAVIPDDWEKSFCVEYYEEIDFNTDASIIGLTNTSYDIIHAADIAQKFRDRGKKVIFCGIQDRFSQKTLASICNSYFYGFPSKKDMSALLEDSRNGDLKESYEFGLNVNYPFDYSLLEGKKIRYVPLISSIGCVNECEYCCQGTFFKGRYRLRNYDHVLADLKSVSKWTKYGVFLDSNFYNNREYAIRLCKKIVEHRIRFTWGAQLTVDIADDDEALHYLKKAGCRGLILGLETVDQANLQYLKKNYDAEKYLTQLLKLRQKGFFVIGNFMVGLDHDTINTFDTLYRFIKKSKIALPLVNILLPIPGSPLFDRLKDEQRVHIADEEEFIKSKLRYSVPCNKCYFKPKNMREHELEQGFMNIYYHLSRYKEIFTRSIIKSVGMIPTVLYLNLRLRKEFEALAKGYVFNS
jgi:radical SAM superfamily enzyme YgiQ (UPF0313 family)